jgi:hypothetical protein
LPSFRDGDEQNLDYLDDLYGLRIYEIPLPPLRE